MGFKVEVTGFSSLAEAQAFVDWYSGQGEQDSATWFSDRKDEGLIQHSIMNHKADTVEGSTVMMEVELYE